MLSFLTCKLLLITSLYVSLLPPPVDKFFSGCLSSIQVFKCIKKKKVQPFAVRIIMDINSTISVSERLKGNNTDKGPSGDVNTVYNKMQ